MKAIRSAATVALLALGLPAAAHEGTRHATKDGPVAKEQKAWGIAGNATAVRRTVVLTMTDGMRFTPDHIEVKRGETVRIVARNDGKMLHEIVIGTKNELDEHAAMMLKFPDMQHDEPYMAHVPPGKVGEIVWTFNRAGEFDFACLIPGHYQAGMAGKISVK